MRHRILSAALITIFLLFWAAGASPADTRTVTADGAGVITVPVSDVSTTARYYSYSNGTTRVRFLAVLGTDAVPRIAFDACEVCGGRLGYEQQGTDIRCRACGRVFRIDDIGSKNRTFGCWPSYLPHRVAGGRILINAADLRKAMSLFD
jgi:uncharacterized membrane protein